MNGETICVGGGWQGAVHLELSDGWMDRALTPESVGDHSAEIMHSPTTPLTAFSSSAVRHLMTGFRGPDRGGR